MDQTIYTIPVMVDKKIYRDFALFNCFKRQKSYRSPAIFTGSFLIFAAICFLMRDRTEQAVLLGSVLASIAIILPAVYFGTFFHSIQVQSKKLKLQTPQYAYTVQLGTAEEGIEVTSKKEKQAKVTCKWSEALEAWRNKDCIYLFISSCPTARAAFPPKSYGSCLANGWSLRSFTDDLQIQVHASL